MDSDPIQFLPARDEIDISTKIIIVVGAHLEAEIRDRPIAAWLRDALNERLDQGEFDSSVRCVLCTDLWYLNNQPLRLRPTIAVGSPEVNAASAFLAGHVPTTLVMDGSLRIHVDLESSDPRACVWGESADATRTGAEMFLTRYGDEFLRGN